ncbi:MAG TPA: CopD family protein [Acidiferrobacter sp.]|nr:CopD family protein [Acidiferrobacter sp.]
MPRHTLYVAISAFDIGAIATVVGALSCRLWIVPSAAIEHFHQRLWRLLGVGLFGLTVSSLALLIGRTMEMSRQPLARVWHWLPLVVHETQFGHVWLARPPVVLLMWAVWLVGRRPSHGGVAGVLMFLAVGIIAFTRSATGHPVDLGPWTFPEWVDWVHLMGGAIWAGSLLVMTFSVFPTLTDPDISVATRATLVKNLSTVAATALAVILVTGLWSAYHYLNQWGSLWHSTYGHTLLVKLFFVLGAIALGALNRFVYVPRIRAAAHNNSSPLIPARSAQTDPLRLLTRSAAVETVVLLVVLVTAAALLHDMPPRDARANGINSMARAHDRYPTSYPRLERAAVRPMANPSAIPTVRYGVLDFPGHTTYSTGPSKLSTDAIPLRRLPRRVLPISPHRLEA